MSVLPNTLTDIITKVRRITGRPSTTQISDNDIIRYINTFYIYDMPEHLKFISLRYNYEFLCAANIPVYDLPTDVYLTAMPPVFIAGYQTYMTQSRQNFFRINPELNFEQVSLYTGNGTGVPYTGGFLNASSSNTALTGSSSASMFILPGFKANPPGAYSAWSPGNDIPASALQWNVLITAAAAPNATSGIPQTVSLVDDGQGNLFSPNQPTINPVNNCGTVNYITGAVTINQFLDVNNNPINIPAGNPINAQYIPYVASRPTCAMFFQDQILLYPIPDQAYTVSFEVYKYPTAFLASQGANTPQLAEWWQLLAYGAADKVFADNGDFRELAEI